MVYGFDEDRRDANLQFKRHSTHGFIKDLASCCYVICGGGHTLISESLYYGKPAISFPVVNAFEQFLNAHYLEQLGYGVCVTSMDPDSQIIPRFEDRLPEFQAAIGGGRFLGNPEIFRLFECFVRDKQLCPR
jgi:uncharacterized protein (TIGR00661 family)